jgi:hypothetical protein
MSIAEKYLKEQVKSDEFRKAYLEEKTKPASSTAWKN